MKPDPQNSIKIPIKDFAKKIICDGHLYISSKEGRKFYVMKPGILLDNGFVKKHALTNTVFDFQSVINQEVLDKFASLFRELRYLQFEKDLRMKSLEILEYFHKTYSGEEHLLSLALAAYQEFCHLPKDVINLMHETDMHLFRKSIYAGALAIIIALSNDFYHFMMIRDFYNLTLSLDLGLCEANYSYYVAQACNQENRKPGTGQTYLIAQHASEMEIKIFFNHPKKTYEFLKSHPDVLAHPELAEVALYQHELSEGNGFPRGLPKGQVSSWEAIVILADSMVEIEDHYDFETSVVKYLSGFQNDKLGDIPVSKVYRKLCQGFQHFDQLKGTGT